MDRSREVEQLAAAWLAGMKAGDAAAVASLFAAGAATTVIGNGADQWFTGDAYTGKRLAESLAEHGGIPFEPGSPVGWAAGDTGWFADQVTIAFPARTIPLRMTGVAVRQHGTWRLVQLHVSAAVSDEDLLTGGAAASPPGAAVLPPVRPGHAVPLPGGERPDCRRWFG